MCVLVCVLVCVRVTVFCFVLFHVFCNCGGYSRGVFRTVLVFCFYLFVEWQNAFVDWLKTPEPNVPSEADGLTMCR